MAASETASLLSVLQPYPGLRPFEPDEALKFYGRETHTADLLRRLSENRFIAVVGNSGSGKSSLVRAGLLPALYRGRLAGATSQWRICILRPGDAPMQSLARSLVEQGMFSKIEATVLAEVSRSSLGLVRVVRTSQLASGESLLLVVDQFEEVFRFARARKQQDGGAEARLFVASLLKAADLSSAPVYVALTMRSDFLGDCSQFPGLLEALNRSQYLIPRMTREQVRAAIEKPVQLAGARMSGHLVELLLNELGEDTGQLPVLQHALNRTFHEWKKRGTTGEIGVDDYGAAGGMKGALNAHAESLLEKAGEVWTEKVFRCLTSVESGRRIRRPTRLDRMFEIIPAAKEAKNELLRVIDTYSDPEHAMLVCSNEKLSGESVIDISHESLIEHWERLKAWTTTEANAASLFQAAAQEATAKRRGSAARWRGQKLSEALEFLEKGPWNEAWAKQLPGSDASFAEVKDFVHAELAAQNADEEEKEIQRRRELAAERRAKLWILATAVSSVALLGAGLWAQSTRAARAKSEAARANSDAARAKSDAARAESDAARAESQKDLLALRQEIATANDIFTQSKREIEDLKKQLGQAKDAEERERLKYELSKRQEQQTRAQEQRDSAAAQLRAGTKVETKLNPVDGLTYVYVLPGSFLMGCSPGDNECGDDEKPPQTERVVGGFWLAQTEVTQAAWAKVKGGNPSYLKSDQLPVEQVDWNQATDYCKRIGGRLPTEVEWEYAARAGATGARYGAVDAIAWYSTNSFGTTHPVGLKQPNTFGLYDMLGNAWEWTSSDYDGKTKVVRGGSWSVNSRFVRASARLKYGPRDRTNGLGFRCMWAFR